MTHIISDLAYLEAANRFAQRKRYRDDKEILWTRKREDQLKDLHAIGVDTALIAVELGIGEQTVRRRLKVLGLRR